MIGLNKVFNGQMVDMNASNIKLRGRAEKMVMHLTGCSEVTAKESLDKTGYWVKPALLVAQGVTPDQAQKLLAENHGNLKTTLEHLSIK
jgi:N-acetylmuramic acid 6-phosphate etherase